MIDGNLCNIHGGLGIFVHKSTAIINPYIAKASQSATTRKALKKVSSRSDKEEMAAVPTVFNAQAEPSTVEANAIAADNASTAAVLLL